MTTETPLPPNPSVDLDAQRIELERYKLNLDYRRSIIISGFVAVTIALIPPLFQLATAAIEYVKFSYQLELDAANKKADRDKEALAFQATYVGNFLDKALNQEIEVRLRLAEYFKYLAQGDTAFKVGWTGYYDALDAKRKVAQGDIERMEIEYAALEQNPQNKVKLERLLERLSWKRNEVGYVPLGRSGNRTVSAPVAAVDGNVIKFDSPAIPSGRRVLAEKVVAAFADAGFSTVQQAAALANAIAESGLDPNARSAGDPSVGLFFLHPNGLGAGYTAEQLADPDVNIGLVVGAAKRSSRFLVATTLPDAVAAFVTTIMKPANPTQQIARRLAIAQQLVP